MARCAGIPSPVTMPWTSDALLPTAERYASLKFRRVAQKFSNAKLSWEDAAELVAFLHVVAPSRAAFVFHWGQWSVGEAQRLFAHMENDPDVQLMVQENLAQQDFGDGLACLRAMQDGGWRKGTVPAIVRMAMLDMLGRGATRQQVADAFDVTLDQMRVITKRSWGLASVLPRDAAGVGLWDLTG
jgi:hypothetical protein